MTTSTSTPAVNSDLETEGAMSRTMLDMDKAICDHCNRLIGGGRIDRNQAVIQEHRTHAAARAAALGGYATMERGSYGCESGCEGTDYIVYDAREDDIAHDWDFGDPDIDKLREMADYYGVRIDPNWQQADLTSSPASQETETRQ